MSDQEKKTALHGAQAVRRAVLVNEAAMRQTGFAHWESFAEQAARAFMAILMDDTASPSVVAAILEVFAPKD